MTGTQATVAAQAGESPRSRGAAALAFVVAMLVVFAGQLVSTTATSAGPYVYDASATARVDAHESEAVESGTTQLSTVQERSVSPPVGPSCAPTTPSLSLVAPSGLADDGARFVVDSAGSTTLRARGTQGWIEVTDHAAKRMTQRGISIADVDQALTQTPFNYWHNNMWKVGYYDPGANVFVGTVNGVATTVITPSAGPQYIANLLAAAP